ncbi:GNAT family N-acetyltransferase [Tautonia plasticadhaerens]|uniref:Acetyltransferase (GNAT) family protein n=1 Tax=Tautonia plasticadhaerens TaxID=2527974 RepID=A0A518HDT7_9BACT|nr:GNAT family N-acetyltransferase [Tautonia plasticadhaerens]QDV39015.1 Acetyltransferase (GNAT) family protein [Tautonia plasticadhaerens]
MTDPAIAPLLTDRLRLDRPSWSVLPDYVRMNADPRVMASLRGVRTAEETAAILARLIEHWDRFGFGWYTARDRRSARFAGRGGLRRVMIADREEVELGYGLLPEYWGRGLATELAGRCARLGFEVLGLRELVCITLPSNLASRRVMEKVGFAFDREAEQDGRTHALYRLKTDDWRRSSGRS